jgi:hypothetical protein
MNTTIQKNATIRIAYPAAGITKNLKANQRTHVARPFVLVGSGLAVIGLVFGLSYVDQMMAQNWLMMPFD